MKKIMLHSAVILLLAHSTSVICMDQAIDQSIDTPMITLQLDDKSTYSIQKRKVKKESNTLCKAYYSQCKKSPLIIHNISPEEIQLFDNSLDQHIDSRQPNSFSDYFDKLDQNQRRTLTNVAGEQLADRTKKLCALRLTAQLADKLLNRNVIFENIIKKHCSPEFGSLIMHLRSSIIIDNNIHDNPIVQSPVSCYSPDDCFKKYVNDGSVIFAPKVAGFNMTNFHGKPSKFSITDEKKENYGVVLLADKTNHFVTHTKFIDDTVNLAELHIWTGDPRKIVKTINHNALIARASCSPDGKWLVTVSSFMHRGGQRNAKLMLTYLGNSPETPYLSDILVVPRGNFNMATCFNSASTLLASGKPGKVELFSLQAKKTIHTLTVPFSLDNRSLPWPLELLFNRNDTRLVGCFAHGKLENKHTFMIWNVSDLDNIKELQSLEIATKSSPDATIAFNHPGQDTVAVSTHYATFFFDAHSGAFLGKTATEKGKEEDNIYAAAFSIPHSPITCIGVNKGNNSSCVNLYNHRSGNCVGTIPFAEPLMNGIGMTSNGKFLVTTFDGYKTITTELLKDEDRAPVTELLGKIKLVDFYALLELYKAKKQNAPIRLSQPLYEYIQNILVTEQTNKNIIKQYLC